jgi:hypothetical protein
VLAVLPVFEFWPVPAPVASDDVAELSVPTPVPVAFPASVPVPVVDDKLTVAVTVPLVEKVVLLVDAAVLPVDVAAWVELSEGTGAGGEAVCGWLIGGLAVSGVLAVASSNAANCEPSVFCAGGVGSGRWDEAMAKWARTSDAEPGTINPCGRKAATYLLQPAGQPVMQIKSRKFNILA